MLNEIHTVSFWIATCVASSISREDKYYTKFVCAHTSMRLYIHIYRGTYSVIFIVIGNEQGYHCRKWTWWPEFKSWTRLFAFHIALISSGKVWIQLFSHQLCRNNRGTGLFNFHMVTSYEEGKLWIQTFLYIYIYIYIIYIYIYTHGNLDLIPFWKKSSVQKLQALTKYLLKYGRWVNLIAYFLDYAILCMTKTQ